MVASVSLASLVVEVGAVVEGVVRDGAVDGGCEVVRSISAVVLLAFGVDNVGSDGRGL